MRFVPFLVLLFLPLLLHSQSGPTEEAVAHMLEEAPKGEQMAVYKDAAQFKEEDWKRFLEDMRKNYAVAEDGAIFPKKTPAVEVIPDVLAGTAYQGYRSWTMRSPKKTPYTLISGNIEAIGKDGVILIGMGDDTVPIRMGAKAATMVEGDLFEGWVKTSKPYEFTDLIGQSRSVRCYEPVDVRDPELIEVSNYLVKGGKIFGLAPAEDKMCPVCKGFRKYPPNPEEPTNQVVCSYCNATGKVRIRPLYIVYTGRP
jgi:hypothetical protein